MLAENEVKLPIVVAGNKVASDEIREIFTKEKCILVLLKM